MVIAILIAVAGWALAAWVYLGSRPHPSLRATPAQPDWYLMVKPSGEPESLRRLKGPAQEAVYRRSGKADTTRYDRVGTAVVYKARS